MIQTKRIRERGAANRLVLSTVLLSIVAALAIGLAVWGIMNYMDQKNNVDSKVADAVATAKKDQADSDEIKFTARDKEPNRQFVGPDDYGRLTFNYPKTWSVYVDKDASTGGTYEAYLNPVSVPPVSSTQQYALRVTIEQKDYATALTSYDAAVKKGDLKSSSVTADGSNGTRLDGKFSTDIRGSAVILKIRDKTLTLRTDADTFQPDFNALIATIKFNQ
jgi:cytoskeletal protein RodZ